MTDRRAYVFTATLGDDPKVTRRVVLAGEQTLELDQTDARSAETPLAELGLEEGQKIAYLFDYGDNWEVGITVREIREAGDDAYPQVLERRGEPPPQYEYDEE